jgi:hypothetical protein
VGGEAEVLSERHFDWVAVAGDGRLFANERIFDAQGQQQASHIVRVEAGRPPALLDARAGFPAVVRDGRVYQLVVGPTGQVIRSMNIDGGDQRVVPAPRYVSSPTGLGSYPEQTTSALWMFVADASDHLHRDGQVIGWGEAELYVTIGKPGGGEVIALNPVTGVSRKLFGELMYEAAYGGGRVYLRGEKGIVSVPSS